MKFYKTNFEQESTKTPEFLTFAKSFKSQIKKDLQQLGAKLEVFSVGHFYLSGFFSKGGSCYYFSWHNGDSNLMYRTAKHTKDFSGGYNQWVKLSEDLGTQIVLH